jgi:hypothetical protein
MEKSTTLLGSVREGRSEGKLLPQKLERKMSTENYNPAAEILAWNQ